MGLFGPSRKEFQEVVKRLSSAEKTNHFLGMRLQAARGRPRNNTSTASGVDQMGGRFTYEPNVDMRHPNIWKNLDLMEADSHVKGSLRANVLPIVNAEWSVKPATNSDKDKDVADFVSANILRTPSEKYGRDFWMESPWRAQRLGEIMRCLRDGFSVFNYTMKRVKGKVVFDRFQWLEPDTIDGIHPWELDQSDRLVALRRNYRDGRDQFKFDEKIPVRSLKLFVWEMVGARYPGRSILRSAYGAWFRKDMAQRLGLIWLQKAGAPIPIGLYPEEWDDPDVIARSLEFTESMRGSSSAEAYLHAPLPISGREPIYKYVGAEHSEVDRVGTVVSGENAEIAHSTATKSQQLGETKSGARALGKDQRQGEMIMISAVAKIICDQLNHGIAGIPGQVEQLVDLNFRGIKQYPMIVCSKIDPDEGLRAMEKLAPAVAAGIVPQHRDLRKQVTERFGFDLPDEAFDKEPEPQGPPGLPPKKDDDADSTETPPRRRPDDRGEREAQAAHLESREDFVKRVTPLLEPREQEVASRKGGRFPESDGA